MKEGKYTALARWLNQRDCDVIHISFPELNKIISLPNHAYKNRSSWANLSKPMSFCSGWLAAGYIVSGVDLSEQWVEFSKVQVKGRRAKPKICNHTKKTAVESPKRHFFPKSFWGHQGVFQRMADILESYVCVTKAATQQCSAKSLVMLGKLYLKYEEQFDALRKYCSTVSVEYPAAKIIDIIIRDLSGVKFRARHDIYLGPG